MDYTTTAEILKRLRVRRHLTQKELAQQINVTHQAVSSWERGTSMPDIQTLISLSQFYDVNVDAILGKSAMFTPDGGELQRVNQILVNAYRYGVLPSLVFVCSLGIVLFLAYEIHWALQLLFGAIITTILSVVMYKRKIQTKWKVMLVSTIATLVLFGGIYLSNLSYYNRMSLPIFVALEQQDIPMTDVGESIFHYMRETNGVDHSYAILYEEGHSYLQLFDLDRELSEMYSELEVPQGTVEHVFRYETELYVSSHYYGDINDVPQVQTTYLYHFNEDVSTLTEVAHIDGIYLVRSNPGYILFVPSVHGFHENNSYAYDFVTDQILPYLETGELFDFVDNGDIYASVSLEYGEFAVAKLRNDYTIEAVLEDTITYQEVPRLTIFNLKTVAQTNDMVWLLKGKDVIATVEKTHGTMTYSTGEYYLLDGAVYDESFALLSTTTYDYNEEFGVQALYLAQTINQQYIALLPGGAASLQPVEQRQSMFIGSYARHAYYALSVLFTPSLMILGMKRHKEDDFS